MDENKKEIDKATGVETTGHEWDGLKELNNPAPRWWLWVFYLCCIWSFGYWIVYPAWPTLSGHTEGIGEHTQYKQLNNSQAEIVTRRGETLKEFHQASFGEILNDPELYAFAIAGGKSMFKDNCATCHGTGGGGGKGYPNLNDDEWIWGGSLDEIYQTLKYGIRSAHPETRYSMMLAFGKDGVLTADQIDDVTHFVMALNENGMDENHEGYEVFQKNCVSCHGEDAKGDRSQGAPNLTDAIWLYGDDYQTIYKTIFSGRGGMMPNWNERLDEDALRQLSIYVHDLGIGE